MGHTRAVRLALIANPRSGTAPDPAALQALKAGDWHDLNVDDGTIRLNLGEVVYVRTERDEHRVGFGST